MKHPQKARKNPTFHPSCANTTPDSLIDGIIAHKQLDKADMNLLAALSTLFTGKPAQGFDASSQAAPDLKGQHNIQQNFTQEDFDPLGSSINQEMNMPFIGDDEL